jgi:hypothetical protein
MFLTMLNEAEKRAFAVLAQRLVAADEVLRSEAQALEPCERWESAARGRAGERAGGGL